MRKLTGRITLIGMVLCLSLAAGGPLPARANGVALLYLPLMGKDTGPYSAGLYIPLMDGTWAAQVDTAITQTGKRPGVFLISAGFKCAWLNSVAKLGTQLTKLHGLGTMPLITWMPMDCTNGGFGDINAVNLQQILDGQWDAYLLQWANDLNALGYPVMLRFAHEMNIPSYSWGGQYAFGPDGKTFYGSVPASACNSNPLKGCYGDPNAYDGPERYIAAYRYVHDKVAPIATNVIWVWNPNARDYAPGDPSWNHFPNYYPGDAYVDWTGVDGYNWGAQSGNGGVPFVWNTFDDIFKPALTELTSLYPAKPQVIPEYASVEDPDDPNLKAAWIQDALRAPLRYPLLRAMIYVHDSQFWDGFRQPPGPADFQLDSSTAALAAYRQGIAGWSSQPPHP